MAIVGCKRELPSIGPDTDLETNIVVAAHDHTFVAVASLRVPAGYRLDQTGALSFIVERRHREPMIGVNTAVNDVAKNDPDTAGFSRCDGAGGTLEQVLSTEARSDGRVLVCRERFDDQYKELKQTYVVRDLTWRGHEFQAWVSFAVHKDEPEPYDEGKPSDARIADAIAIVDSLQIRPMALEECPKYFKAVRDLKYCPERE